MSKEKLKMFSTNLCIVYYTSFASFHLTNVLTIPPACLSAAMRHKAAAATFILLRLNIFKRVCLCYIFYKYVWECVSVWLKFACVADAKGATVATTIAKLLMMALLVMMVLMITFVEQGFLFFSTPPFFPFFLCFANMDYSITGHKRQHLTGHTYV